MLKDSTPRLGIYAPGDGTGGPWRYVHSLLAVLDPDEFGVIVYCDIQGAYEPRPSVRLISVRGEGGVSQGNPADQTARTNQRPRRARRAVFGLLPVDCRMMVGCLRDAHRLSRRFAPAHLDLFHTQGTGCEISPIAARLAGVPRILGTFHVDSTYDLQRQRNGPPYRALEMMSNRCLDRAVAVSGATARDWVRRTHMESSRIAKIHNGIDPEKFRRRRSRAQARAILGLPDESHLIIGGVGRLEEAKGFDYLLKAAAELSTRVPKLTVAIAGAGPLREQLEANAKSVGVANVVRFLGFRADVQLVLDSLDAFVLPSLCEALPYSLLEAMATELPAIGTRVGGVPEVIVHGETGLLIPPRDANALAAALRTLLESPELRCRMGHAGRERVIQHFNERDMVRKTIQVYRTMLAIDHRRT